MSNMNWVGLTIEDYEKAGAHPSRETVHAWFGAEAVLSGKPKAPVLMKLTARSQYKLYLNGTSVLFGPCRAPERTAYADEIDIAPYLQKGRNSIVLEVLSYPDHPAERKHIGPNYAFPDDLGPAIAVSGALGELDLSDPASWRVFIDTESMDFNGYGMFFLGGTEIVQGSVRKRNPLFQSPFGPGTQPAKALELGGPDVYGVIYASEIKPRPIPLLYRKEKTFPAWEACTVPTHSKVSFVLDAGELTTAYFRIGFRDGAGSTVRMTYAESYYQKDENDNIYKGIRDDASGFIDGIYDTYLPSGDGTDRYEPFRFRTFRFVKIDAETGDVPLTLLPMPYIETAYPLENTRRPAFTDPKREKMYDVALRTLQLCMHDTYEDCPYYEQLLYCSDSRLEMLFTYKVSGDPRLALHCIRLFSDSQTPQGFVRSRYPSHEPQIIPCFSLYYILMLEDYINETGDTASIAPLIPGAERILETFLAKRTKEGLLAAQGYWEFCDWAPEWDSRHGVPNAYDTGVSTIENLLFIYAAQSLIRILPLFHRPELANYYYGEVRNLMRLVNAYCYDAERGLYMDAPDFHEYTQHAQMYAVLTGCIDPVSGKALMEKTLDDPTLIQCTFVQRFYLFRALEKVGLYHRTEALWQTWQDFIDLHCTTFPEAPNRPRSDCHGWSALPLYEFS